MRCPQCGEPVTPFAAGCAICGADLEQPRDRPASRRRLPAVSLRRSLPLDWWMLPATAVVAVVFPLAGIFLAGFAAHHRDLNGERGMRNAFIAVAVLALAVLVIPPLRYGALRLLFAG